MTVLVGVGVILTRSVGVGVRLGVTVLVAVGVGVRLSVGKSVSVGDTVYVGSPVGVEVSTGVVVSTVVPVPLSVGLVLEFLAINHPTPKTNNTMTSIVMMTVFEFIGKDSNLYCLFSLGEQDKNLLRNSEWYCKKKSPVRQGTREKELS